MVADIHRANMLISSDHNLERHSMAPRDQAAEPDWYVVSETCWADLSLPKPAEVARSFCPNYLRTYNHAFCQFIHIYVNNT
jgi:hypothetical protein